MQGEGNFVELVGIRLDNENLFVVANINFFVLATILIIVAIIFVARVSGMRRIRKKFEIDQAEFGIGNSKMVFRPNNSDLQIAYAVWIELSTRKIGLKIDLDNDVILEIYDSWFSFFSVVRELLKSVPVTQIQRTGTEAIVNLSIEVLNEGLRPHLTRWQARYRSWHNWETRRMEQITGVEIEDPQSFQKRFPDYDRLSEELIDVNEKLIRYRQKMYELIKGA